MVGARPIPTSFRSTLCANTGAGYEAPIREGKRAYAWNGERRFIDDEYDDEIKGGRETMYIRPGAGWSFGIGIYLSYWRFAPPVVPAFDVLRIAHRPCETIARNL